ncbi:2OG-Fe(II) oxygenase [Neoaquamicrobium sediminum]|uniref:2OG-Fe(II) oxygenase n=1 Tax=Neoaquamicrobium sediminum TaxID=1849104 RepID=UPI003BAA88E0
MTGELDASGSTHLLDGRIIKIFDNAIDNDQIERIYNALSIASFAFNHSSTDETVDFREWSAELSPIDFVTIDLGRLSMKCATDHAKCLCTCTSVFSSASSYGDNAFVHQDSSHGSSRISVLYYANPHWELEWAGETIFFSGNDARIAISPKPGRIVVFSGDVRHRAGIPSRHCPGVRLVISARFKPNKLM